VLAFRISKGWARPAMMADAAKARRLVSIAFGTRS
jgi:hypothetical protein